MRNSHFKQLLLDSLDHFLPSSVDKAFREMVQNKYNGYLFNKNDEFIKYVLKLKNDKKTYKTMALNAKNSIHRYSKEVFAADVLKIYYKAIEKKNNSK